MENTIVYCEPCNKKTNKIILTKDNFKLRGWKCPSCNKLWLHPADEKDYLEFQKLKERDFDVKLRMIGNSWAISIPRELINFQNVKKTKIVRLMLEEPGKISLFFSKIY